MEEENVKYLSSKPVLDYDMLNLRLNPEPVLKKIRVYLSGIDYVDIEDDNGNLKTLPVRIALAKCNSNGVESIFNWVQGFLNPHVGQGNFPIDKNGYSEKYEDYIEYMRKDLSHYLMVNMYAFEIPDQEFEGIVDFIMHIAGPFMSRLIDNKERESYTATLSARESNVVSEAQKKGFLSGLIR